MPSEIEYTRGEKIALISLGAVGIIALNMVFIYTLLFQPELVLQAHTNPVSAVFIAEAILLMGFFAYFLQKWGVTRLGWGWFVVLSILGSMAFALPVVLLWPKKKQGQPPVEPGTH